MPAAAAAAAAAREVACSARFVIDAGPCALQIQQLPRLALMSPMRSALLQQQLPVGRG